MAYTECSEQLYFDGFLPNSKRPVRMERTLKNMSQITFFYNTNSGGCPKTHIPKAIEPTSFDAFLTGKPETKPFTAPSFLVPAIIDALRKHPKYGNLIRIVPGEADGFCARHVASTGATVLTSDSDLLVHDLGPGSVALFRDVYRGEDGVVHCSIYTPSQIFPRLGLSSPSDVHRFAYERWRTTHATVTSLVRACEESVLDGDEFREFCVQYLSEEDAGESVPRLAEHLTIQHLDPRFCELLLQIGQPEYITPDEHPMNMFLPILIENPERGTAWEQSTSVRKLAYSIARRILPGRRSTVQEYRRVQTLDQKGRQVTILPTKDMLSNIEELVQIMTHLKEQTQHSTVPFWTILYIVLDARECFSQGKDSFLLATTLQGRLGASWPRENAARVSWDFMHFVAQLQAMYYSLRMVWQVLHMSFKAAEGVVGNNFKSLLEMLNGMPELSESPNVEDVAQFLLKTHTGSLRRVLSAYVDLPAEEAPNDRSKLKPGKSEAKMGEKKTQKATGAPKQNMFDMLDMA